MSKINSYDKINFNRSHFYLRHKLYYIYSCAIKNGYN